MKTMNIHRFADQHRLRIDWERGLDGKILERDSLRIPGSRGELYFDGPDLCLMVTNGRPVNRSRWVALGGKLWMGDISPDKNSRRAQDVKITGIPLENAKLAIRLVGAKRKRVLSEAQRAAAMTGVSKALAARGLPKTTPGTHPTAVESIAQGRVDLRANRRDEEAKSGLL